MPDAPNLADLLFEHPFGAGRVLLVGIDPPAEWTADAAREAARDVARRVEGLGIGPGRAVAVQIPDSPEAVAAMMGIWRAGAVMVPINPRHPDAEVQRILAATGPAAVARPGGIEPLDGPHRTYAAGSAFVLWTSGTTGAPKPIVHTHADYLELIDRVLAPLRAGGAPRSEPVPNLIPVGLSLNAGIYNLLFGLRAGAAVIVLGRFDPARFAATVRRYGIRSTVLPPAAMAALADAPDIDDLAPLRYVRSITAPLAPRVARRFTERFGAFVLNSYGQAELGEVIGWTAADAKEHPDKLGAAGRPHRGVAVRLAGADGEGIGRLLVRPPAMAHVEADSDLAGRIDAEGFVDTGDLARVDADGFVWIEGRASDVINRGGNKVVPDEVEDALRAVPGVRDAGVVGVPDERLGQVPVAFVVADAAVTDAALDAALRAELVAYKVPVAYRRVAALPRNEIGKLLRRELVADE